MNADRHLRIVPDEPDPDTSTTDADADADASPRRIGHPRGAELATLLERTGRGSASAFEQVYNAVAGSVYGVALRIVRDPAMAEDVAQEALVEVWAHAARYRADAGSARAWILTIAHRRAVDRVRSEQAHRDRLRAHTDRTSATDAASPPAQDAVVDTLYAQWEAARVRAGLASLTERQREALQLTYFRGYTHREAARALDVPLGTMKARVRDGLIKLRDALEVQR